MLDNSHKTVCDNNHTDLYANIVLCCAPEFLYLEMLFEPFEEQFDQSSFLIKVGDIQYRKLFRIRQKSELTVIFFIVISDESE